jgi:hypothetical protein
VREFKWGPENGSPPMVIITSKDGNTTLCSSAYAQHNYHEVMVGHVLKDKKLSKHPEFKWAKFDNLEFHIPRKQNHVCRSITPDEISLSDLSESLVDLTLSDNENNSDPFSDEEANSRGRFKVICHVHHPRTNRTLEVDIDIRSFLCDFPKGTVRVPSVLRWYIYEQALKLFPWEMF